MNAFAVMIQDPEAPTYDRLNQKYDPANVYRVNKMTFLVRTKQLAEDVSVVAGIKGDERFVSGVVFKLNRYYAGYASRSLWEWLQEDEK
ncbi:MAG: hypothetical protein F4139_14210 [Gemmatimonadetes bacterium]|nr:hypothetical protein [Gemmatimonadota bacterium]MYH54073.1 hypothetical protein [Gemmatimonadota bacterium]MYK65378.1 hypothetical protein [Gemmatimonadota bacterium]